MAWSAQSGRWGRARKAHHTISGGAVLGGATASPPSLNSATATASIRVAVVASLCSSQDSIFTVTCTDLRL